MNAAVAESERKVKHVFAVHDFGTTPDGDSYLVMQLVSAGSIADRLPLPVADALAIAAELCGALAYAVHDFGTHFWSVFTCACSAFTCA